MSSEPNDWKISNLKPEQWNERQFSYSSAQWAEIEREEHDERYAKAYPFGLDSYKFSPERALWYEDYAYKKGRRRDRGHRTKKFLEVIGLEDLSGLKVLDIGCGIGQYGVLLAQKGATVTGIELSPVAIEIAKKMALVNGVAERCNFIAGDFSNAEIEEQSYDLVLLHEVYHHLIKYEGVKERLLRCPRPGGRIVIADGVRGGGLIHLGRRLTKFVRYKRYPELKEHEINAGDVLLSIADLHDLGRCGASYEIFQMSYVYMVKETFLQWHTSSLPVRLALRGAKIADDILLTCCPFLKPHCGEFVMSMVVK